MSSVTLSTARRVLDYVDHEDDGVLFSNRTDHEDEVTTTLMVPLTDFIDMGEPLQVTVTIRPGDTLNPRDTDD